VDMSKNPAKTAENWNLLELLPTPFGAGFVVGLAGVVAGDLKGSVEQPISTVFTVGVRGLATGFMAQVAFNLFFPSGSEKLFSAGLLALATYNVVSRLAQSPDVGGGGDPPPPAYNNPPPYSAPARGQMSQQDFSQLLARVVEASFDNDRVRLLQLAVPYHSFTCAQTKEILEATTFGDGQVQIGCLMYPNIVDKENFFDVVAVLTFSSDKEKLMRGCGLR